MSTFLEGNLQFDFSAAESAEQLDAQGIPLPVGMSFVDFVVDETRKCLLVEVKAPSAERVPPAQLQRFIGKMKTKELIHQELTPKVRDSYTFLHLMERDTKPFVYIVVIGLEQLEPPLLVQFRDRLLERIRKEAESPWKRQYVKDCVILTPRTWGERFAEYPICRVTGTAANAED